MRDLEIAKSQLRRKNCSLVIAKDGKVIFETKESGVSGFLSAIDKLGRSGLYGSSVADRVVGRAAAMLCVYCSVKAVYAIVASNGGREVLKEHGVPLEFENLVPNILNRQQTDTCPFEKVVATISDAKEAYERLRSCIKETGKR
jgi:hypothetical protein